MSEIIVEFLREKFINGFHEAEQELNKNFPLYSDFQVIEVDLKPISVSKLQEDNGKSWLYKLNDTLAACITFGEQRRGPIKANPLTEHNFVTKMQKELKPIKQSLEKINKSPTSPSAQASAPPAISSSSTALAVDNLEKVLYGAYEIYGFDPQYLKTITESLLKNGSIGIVGMGGSGKSALAQVLLKTVMTQKHFQMGFWLSLSELIKDDDYNKVIVKSVRLDSAGDLWVDKHDNLSIKEVEPELLKLLTTDNLPSIMVIDGANHESKWCKSLLSAMEEFKSKIGIVVTSRVLDVAAEMVGGEKNVHQMQLLEKESCWSIFEDTVNENGLVDVAHPIIVRMKDEIKERCYGLPLAAKTLAEIIPNQIYALECATL